MPDAHPRQRRDQGVQTQSPRSQILGNLPEYRPCPRMGGRTFVTRKRRARMGDESFFRGCSTPRPHGPRTYLPLGQTIFWRQGGLRTSWTSLGSHFSYVLHLKLLDRQRKGIDQPSSSLCLGNASLKLWPISIPSCRFGTDFFTAGSSSRDLM